MAMNYRHAFHAGNFADVLKHIVLARLLTHLKQKEAPFRVIDTHAGVGLYDLEGDEAQRTGEWHDGVGLVAADADRPAAGTPAAIPELLAPWRGVVDGLMAQKPPLYPGSPWLAADLTRAQDHLVFCEKHPQDAESLRRNFARSRLTSVGASAPTGGVGNNASNGRPSRARIMLARNSFGLGSTHASTRRSHCSVRGRS